MVRIKAKTGARCLELVKGAMVFYMGSTWEITWADDGGQHIVGIEKDYVNTGYFMESFLDVWIDDEKYDEIKEKLSGAIDMEDYHRIGEG